MSVRYIIHFLNMYPQSFTNKVKEEKVNYVEVRSNLNLIDDIKQWVNEYRTLTNTHWVARSSIPLGTKMLCS